MTAYRLTLQCTKFVSSPDYKHPTNPSPHRAELAVRAELPVVWLQPLTGIESPNPLLHLGEDALDFRRIAAVHVARQLSHQRRRI